MRKNSLCVIFDFFDFCLIIGDFVVFLGIKVRIFCDGVVGVECVYIGVFKFKFIYGLE